MTDSAPQVFDLESNLTADVDGTFLGQMTESLADEQADVKRRLSAGLAPEEFRAAEQYSVALEAASDVVTKIWNREHQQ